MSYELTDQYVAGFFDGEGCVSSQLMYKTGKYEQFPWINVHVTISQKSRAILDIIAAKFGGTVSKKDNKTGGCYHLVITGKPNMYKFLTAIYPYSFVKKEQIALALEFVETLRTENLGPVLLEDNIHIKRRLINSKLKLLKKAS